MKINSGKSGGYRAGDGNNAGGGSGNDHPAGVITWTTSRGGRR
jgi:hypothetical protein